MAPAVSAVNAFLKGFFYATDQTAALAAVYAATGPAFALLAAGTLVAARRRLTRVRGRAELRPRTVR